jgi:hypothetical protein
MDIECPMHRIKVIGSDKVRVRDHVRRSSLNVKYKRVGADRGGGGGVHVLYVSPLIKI